MAKKKEALNADMEELGANIRKYRKQKKWTLEQLADKLGGTYSAKVLCQYERGYINIGSQAIIDISHCLSVTPNQLYPGWITEQEQNEVILDFLRLDKENQEAVRDVIQRLLKYQILFF